MEQTPLKVGSPQEAIDKTLTFRENFGDDQRQLFLMDHAGLPLKTVLEQLELLGDAVIPVLRKELDSRRPADVPDGPTRTSEKPRRARDEHVAQAADGGTVWEALAGDVGGPQV